MRFVVLGAILLFASNNLLGQGAPSSKYQEGIHFTVIEKAPEAPAPTKAGKLEVVEAFSYMCTHCATFEPYIDSWLQRKPENVDFKRIPVVFGRGSWELYARAYVTAEVMGIANESHGALMDKIWKEHDTMKTMEELADFYSAFGVEPGVFTATSKSFAVDAKMRKDQRTIQAAEVRGTPSLIIAGKYLVAGSEAVANYDTMLDVVDFLLAREMAESAAAATLAVEAEKADPSATE